MESIFVVNGTVELVLVPQNEMDRILLDKLTSNGPLDITIITQPVGVLTKPVKNGVIIKAKSHDTNQT